MSVTVTPVRGLPEVRPGDDLAGLIAAAAPLRDGDVIVVAQKVVSKAEGALVRLPTGADRTAARRRLTREHAARVLVDAPWTTVVQTRHGLVCANAGIDASNAGGDDLLVLLPDDPDTSARRLRAALQSRSGADVAVVVTDTFGRPWREGQTDVAIGLAGLAAFRDERGSHDRDGALLGVTQVALADEVAAAADLVRRKADGVPVVIVRGLDDPRDEGARAADLVRTAATDLFPRGRGALADALGTGAAALRPLTAADRGRALAAAERVAEGRVHLEPSGEDPWRVELSVGADAEDLVALGAAAATLAAALLDLGAAARVGPVQHGDGRTAVLVQTSLQ